MDFLNALGRELRISASSTETYLDCKRKWAYGYYWRVPRVTSPAAEVGNKVHDVLETYLDLGEKPEDPNNRYWRIAEPGLQFLPEVITAADGSLDYPINPGLCGVVGNWKVEEWVKCKCGPLNFVGKVDLYNLEDFDNIQIDDHKTTGDSSWRWAKTPRQLAELIQPHAYAWSLVEVHRLDHPESVDFRHIYYATKGPPKAMEVRAPNVPWENVEKTWRKLETIAEQMAKLALTITEPEEVEATTSSCKKYGGCPYAEICSASPLNRSTPKPKPVIVTKDEEMSDRLTALRAQLGIKKSAPAPVQKEPTPLPVVEDPQGDAQALADKLVGIMQSLGEERLQVSTAEAMAKSADVHLYEAMEIANLTNTGGFLVPRGTASQEEPSEPSGLELLTVSRGEEAAQILTQWDEYLVKNNKRMSRKIAQAIVREATGAQRVRKERILHYIEQFNEAHVNRTIRLQGHMIIETALLASHKSYAEKDVKPAKDLGEATLDKPASSKSDASPKPAKDSGVEGGSSRKPPSSASESNALPKPEDTPLGRIVKEVATPTIYIDCIPEDPAGVYSFTDFVREFEKEVEKEGGKVDDKFTQPLPYYGLLDYGQGPKRVAGKVLSALHRVGPQLFRGDMYVDGKHPLADEIIPILRRLKGVRVVRASR